MGAVIPKSRESYLEIAKGAKLLPVLNVNTGDHPNLVSAIEKLGCPEDFIIGVGDYREGKNIKVKGTGTGRSIRKYITFLTYQDYKLAHGLMLVNVNGKNVVLKITFHKPIKNL